VLIGLTMSLPFSVGSAAKALRPMRPGLIKIAASANKPIAANLPVSSNIPYRRHSESRRRVCRRESFSARDTLVFISVVLRGGDFSFGPNHGFSTQAWKLETAET